MRIAKPGNLARLIRFAPGFGARIKKIHNDGTTNM